MSVTHLLVAKRSRCDPPPVLGRQSKVGGKLAVPGEADLSLDDLLRLLCGPPAAVRSAPT